MDMQKALAGDCSSSAATAAEAEESKPPVNLPEALARAVGGRGNIASVVRYSGRWRRELKDEAAASADAIAQAGGRTIARPVKGVLHILVE